MSPKELKALAKTMRELGITHLKTADVELNLSTTPPILKKTKKDEEELKSRPPIIDDMARVLQMSDMALVDHVFPLPKEDEHGLPS